jgi:hypothetical protein
MHAHYIVCYVLNRETRAIEPCAALIHAPSEDDAVDKLWTGLRARGFGIPFNALIHLDQGPALEDTREVFSCDTI